MISRKNLTDRERIAISYDHAALTADTTVKLYKVPAGKSLEVTRVSYINPTGLALDPTNAFALQLKNDSTVVAAIANTDTDDNPAGVAIPADTFVEGVLSATAANVWLDAAEVLSILFDEDGTATLPAGRLVVEGYLY
jgi:hypothetical protein